MLDGRVQYQQPRRLGISELSRAQRMFSHQLALGRDESDGTGLGLFGQVLPNPEDGADGKQSGHSGHLHGEHQELCPLHGVVRPATDQHEAVERALRLQWRNLDR